MGERYSVGDRVKVKKDKYIDIIESIDIELGFDRYILSGLDTTFISEQLELVTGIEELNVVTTDNFEEKLLKSASQAVEYARETPQKFDAGKPMVHLVQPSFILGIAEGLTYGFEKYSEKRGDINFLRGEGHSYTKIYDSMQRHIMAWASGEEIDPESGVSHLSLAGANLMFLHTYQNSDKGIDDRTPLKKKVDKDKK
jgi:hypothetical protein